MNTAVTSIAHSAKRGCGAQTVSAQSHLQLMRWRSAGSTFITRRVGTPLVATHKLRGGTSVQNL